MSDSPDGGGRRTGRTRRNRAVFIATTGDLPRHRCLATGDERAIVSRETRSCVRTPLALPHFGEKLIWRVALVRRAVGSSLASDGRARSTETDLHKQPDAYRRGPVVGRWWRLGSVTRGS
jgi:hypothetical protein